MQKLDPEVISLAKYMDLLYSNGFKKPNVGRPDAFLCAFTKLTNAAMTGDDAEVPSTPACDALSTVK